LLLIKRFGLRSLGVVGLIAVFVPLLSATAGCQGCGKKLCMPPGLYLYSGALPTGTIVELCVDGECHTALVQPLLEAPLDDLGSIVQYQHPLPAGKQVDVTITVRDSAGATIGQVSENRNVASGSDECECGSLIYKWTNIGKVVHFAG
jgi:hypothetical protein